MSFLSNLFRKKEKKEEKQECPKVAVLDKKNDNHTVPKNTSDFNDAHIRLLRKLNKSPCNANFSGKITLELDIQKCIIAFLKMELIEVASFEDSLSFLKVENLKNILREAELKVSGSKSVLVERITKNLSIDYVKASNFYKSFYVLTENGKKVILEVSKKIEAEEYEFRNKAISLISDGKLDVAYKMICKKNAESVFHGGINSNWEKNYKNGISTEDCNFYSNQLDSSSDIISTSIAIYCDISGESVHRMQNIFDPESSSAINCYLVMNSTREINEYKKNEVEKYQFTVTLDDRTCEICGNLDGKVFHTSQAKIGVNFPPMHDNCRCCTTAYFGNELPKIRFARNPITKRGEKIPYVTYNEWINKYKN